MRDVDRVNSCDFLTIKPYLHRAFHEISGSKIREPAIDEDADIFSLMIHYIDEEFCMSERGDDHRKSDTIKPQIYWGFVDWIHTPEGNMS